MPSSWWSCGWSSTWVFSSCSELTCPGPGREPWLPQRKNELWIRPTWCESVPRQTDSEWPRFRYFKTFQWYWLRCLFDTKRVKYIELVHEVSLQARYRPPFSARSFPKAWRIVGSRASWMLLCRWLAPRTMKYRPENVETCWEDTIFFWQGLIDAVWH